MSNFAVPIGRANCRQFCSCGSTRVQLNSIALNIQHATDSTAITWKLRNSTSFNKHWNPVRDQGSEVSTGRLKIYDSDSWPTEFANSVQLGMSPQRISDSSRTGSFGFWLLRKHRPSTAFGSVWLSAATRAFRARIKNKIARMLGREKRQKTLLFVTAHPGSTSISHFGVAIVCDPKGGKSVACTLNVFADSCPEFPDGNFKTIVALHGDHFSGKVNDLLLGWRHECSDIQRSR